MYTPSCLHIIFGADYQAVSPTRRNLEVVRFETLASPEGAIIDSTHRTNHLQINHLQIYQIDPNLPFGGAAQDVYNTDPTQGACPRSCSLYGSHSGNMSYQ